MAAEKANPVKFLCAILTAVLLLAGTQAGFSQGFINLGFNSANIPQGTTSGSTIPISEAIPDWTSYFETSQNTSVLYNDLDIGSVAIALLDTNGPVGGLIPGNDFTVVLQAGFNDSGNVAASIAQTGLIPSMAESILFEASIPYAAGWQVTVAGQNIPVTKISTINSDYGVYAGNISAFAGQEAQLEFTALAGAGPSVNMYLDDISFSTSSVPEPSEYALIGLGAMLVGLYRRRKP